MSDTLRVVPQPVRRQVEEGLRAAIVGGRFAPGEHLRDRVLCDLFGASRGVVREAVRLLEAEGLVTVHPNRGPFVAHLTVAEAAQIYEVRGVLEALAGEGFARNATDAERAELRAVWVRRRAPPSGSANNASPPTGTDTGREAAIQRRDPAVVSFGPDQNPAARSTCQKQRSPTAPKCFHLS